MVKRLSFFFLAAAAVAGFLIVAPQAQASTVTQPLRTAVARLPVAVEVRIGYRRELFPHWIDADGDRCDTRNEVLIAEATTIPSVSGPCVVTGGAWYSYYDDATWTVPTDLDVDHVVPLAEAWDSGARTWPTTLRRAYANDLDDERSLIAVTDNVNQDKGDQDPATWMPPYQPAHCRYVGEWVAVKIRWRLTVDTAERDTLTRLAGACPNVPITVTHAY